MSEVFLKIVNMSISASWLVLAELVLRLILTNAPKWINVLLWGIVAVRLICPFSIESPVSLIPDSIGNGELVSEWMDDYIGEVSIIHDNSIHYDAAVAAGREPVSDGRGGYYVVTKYDQLGEPSTIENTVMPVLTVIWTIGMTLLALYTAISYWRLRRRVDTAVRYKDNIFQSENVSSPFVLGIIKPRIYLPFKLDGQDLEHVVAHEKAHIRRKDHWWKPLGFLLLTIHWFNPLMWLAYVLLCRDIELACDEKVIAELGNEQRADYTQALVACSVNRRMIAACPLAFGEVGVKERVKSIMNYRKPTFRIVVTALVVCAIVAVCFLTDPNPSREFSMHGNNVADLDPEAIVERILDIENWETSNIYMNSDNFSLTVDSDFNWVDSQAIRYFFRNYKNTYSAQLRIFPEENKYFITESSEWIEEERIFLLRHYLDALKYLPQDKIRQMAPADRYIIQHIDGGRPSDYERVITYSSEGVEDTDGWFIHLSVQPLHAIDGAYQGTGEEVVDVYYGESYGSVAVADNIAFGFYDLEGKNIGITEIRLRNLHNGQDTTISDTATIDSIISFISTVEGANRTSSKGYYGGSYQVEILNGSKTVFSIGFGDDDSFNFGDYGDGYPARYELWGVTREDVLRFFGQLDSSNFDWGLQRETAQMIPTETNLLGSQAGGSYH